MSSSPNVPARYLIEVAVETPDDARTAEDGGADRIELSCALDLGGLTPSVGLYQETLAATKLPVYVMIRPRPGDFVYSETELRTMARDIRTFLPLSPDGFVFGVVTEDGGVNADEARMLRDLCGHVPCVFHRAFDRCPDPAAALEQLITIGFARVLTSGREATALAGSSNIRELAKAADGRIELLPCGRVRASNVETVVMVSGCHQVHASFGEAAPEPTSRGRRGYPTRSTVGLADLMATRKRLDELAEGGPG